MKDKPKYTKIADEQPESFVMPGRSRKPKPVPDLVFHKIGRGMYAAKLPPRGGRDRGPEVHEVRENSKK